MNNKIRITLGVALYVLLCINDYVFKNTINWEANILQTIITMVIAWLVIEVLSNNGKKV